MNRIYPLAAFLALAASPALIGCGGGASHPAAASTTTSAAASTTTSAAASTTTSATVTCAQAKPTIQDLVKAQGKLDASQQTVRDDELYIVALDEGIAVIRAERWPAAGTQLGSELHQFESDASQFTSGDLAVQQNVTTDISALAADCGIAASGL